MSESKGSALRAIKAVLWAFVGIRKGADRDKDLAQVRPLHAILAGLIGAAVFLFVILSIVRLVTR